MTPRLAPLLAAALVSGAVVQPRPDFSGTWTFAPQPPSSTAQAFQRLWTGDPVETTEALSLESPSTLRVKMTRHSKALTDSATAVYRRVK